MDGMKREWERATCAPTTGTNQAPTKSQQQPKDTHTHTLFKHRKQLNIFEKVFARDFNNIKYTILVALCLSEYSVEKKMANLNCQDIPAA